MIKWIISKAHLADIVISDKEIMFLAVFVCLLTTLLKSFEWIVIKFAAGIWSGERNKWFNFVDPFHDLALMGPEVPWKRFS